MFSQLHALLPVRQEVCDPPAGGVRHVQLGELVLKQGGDDGVKSRAEVHKKDPGVGCWGPLGWVGVGLGQSNYLSNQQ